MGVRGSGRGPSAFAKTIFRAIRGSLGRFLAIMGIVALGCGFYAGLQMCGPDMRIAADEYYDGTNLYDVRIVSTMGLTNEDVKRVEHATGVSEIMPTMTCDALVRLDRDQLVIRFGTVDASDPLSPWAMSGVSGGASEMNQVRLVEGTWPRSSDECVITSDGKFPGVRVGATIEVLAGTTDLTDVLRTRTFRVVGLVSSSSYPYTGGFGSTSLGSGVVGLYGYLPPAAFVGDMPYTELYLRVSGARAYESGSSAYEREVGSVLDALRAQRDALAAGRLADVRAKALGELADGRAEYDKARDEAQNELADARAELQDAAGEIERGERELRDGQAQYEEGKRTYESQRSDAYSQLADGQRQIDDARRQIDEGARKLEESAAQVEQGRKDIASGTQQLCQQTGASDLAGAKAALEAQRGQASDAVAQLEQAKEGAVAIVDGRAQLAAQRAQLEQARAAWEAGVRDLLSGLAAQGIPASSAEQAAGALQATIAQLEASHAPAETIAPLRTALERATQLVQAGQEIDQSAPALDAGEAELAAREQELLSGLAAQGVSVSDAAQAISAVDGAMAQAQDGIAKVDEGLAAVARLEEAQRQVDEGAAQLESGRRELEASRQKAAGGQAELDAKRAEAQRQLAAGQRDLDNAAGELEQGARKLRDGRAEYEDGLDSYRRGEAEANERLGDARRELDDAQREIDELEQPDIYALARDKNEGIVAYDSDSHRIDSIASVFPFVFFLVAALVALTTMTRMVEDDRVLIGTYKALGYSTWQIAGKYLAYAGAASVTGAVVGILLLSQVLPFIVTTCYQIIYAVPILSLPLPVAPGVALMAGGMGVGVALLATWFAVVRSLRETPASLMLPRAPAAGKRIMLERVGPIWRRLSFSWKVTCRNLFRYKRRMFMTVVGISGCAALLLVGFGLHDAIWDIIDNQYGPIVHYDTTVVFDDDLAAGDVGKAAASLEDSHGLSDVVRVQTRNVQVGSSTKDGTNPAQLVTARNEEELSRAVTLRERISGAPLEFGDDAVVVTEKMATLLGIGVGDQIVLYEQDDIGNASGDGVALSVTGVAEYYVSHKVFVGRNVWSSLGYAEPTYSTILANCSPDTQVQEELSSYLHERGDVLTVSFSSETIDTYRTMISVVNLVVVVLIVSAAALAFIVLYNLTNINVEERVREIASLKVLGFTRGEVYAYIFREILLLSLFGALLGMVLGSFLATFVITTAEVDYVMFGRTIHPLSYVYAFLLTMAFATLILLVMRKKLDGVDMVESLKSVE